MHHFVTEMCTCAHFCYKMVHCGIFVKCIVGFVRLVYCLHVCLASHCLSSCCCEAMFYASHLWCHVHCILWSADADLTSGQATLGATNTQASWGPSAEGPHVNYISTSTHHINQTTETTMIREYHKKFQFLRPTYLDQYTELCCYYNQLRFRQDNTQMWP